MREVVSGVYAITNTKTGEQYIGSSVDIWARWSSHKHHCRNHYDRNALQRAWDEYGPEAFTVTILERVEGDKALNEAEARWYQQLRPAYNGRRFADRPTLHWERNQRTA